MQRQHPACFLRMVSGQTQLPAAVYLKTTSQSISTDRRPQMSNETPRDSQSPAHSEQPPQYGFQEERTFDPSVPPKKRIRVPNACMICRKKKIKCNQMRPACDQCSKRKVPHLCHYEDPQWMHFVRDRAEPFKQRSVGGVPQDDGENIEQNSDVKELLARLKHVEAAVSLSQWVAQEQAVAGNNAQSTIQPANDVYDPKELVELADKQPFLIPFVMRKSRIEFHGCLSPIIDLKKDTYLKIIWLHMWHYLDLAVTDPLRVGNQDMYSFKDGPLNATVLKFLHVRQERTVYRNACRILGASNKTLDEVILEYLPKRRIILSLCTRYFLHFYPLFPLMDEAEFLSSDLPRLLGPWINTNDKPSELFITLPCDYALIGILFTIMAISALTIQPHELENHSDFCLLKGLSTVMFSEVAQMCAARSQGLRKSSNSKVVRLLMHLKFYHEICPEDDTISDRTLGRIELGVINALARSNGLQSDPSNFRGITSESSSFKMWLKIWHKLMEMDATNAAALGEIPHYTDDSSYDTRLPEKMVGMSESEAFVVKDYEFMDRKTRFYRRLSSTLFQRKRTPSLRQLMELIDEVGSFCDTELGSLKDILSNNPQPYARVKKVTYLMELSTLQASLIQRAVGHAFCTGNQEFIHQQFIKLLSTIMKTLNSALNISYNVEKYFGAAFFVFIRPLFFGINIRVTLTLATLLSRCLQCIKKTPFEDHSRLGAYRELRTAILENMNRCSQLSRKSNLGYYNAQRINLGLSFFMIMLGDPSFDFDKAVEDVTNKPIPEEHTRPHDLLGVSIEEVPESSFLSTLLVAEINALRDQLDSDINTVLRPLVGPETSVNIRPGEPIFTDEGGPPASHYGNLSLSSEASNMDSGDIALEKSISFKYMKNKVATVLAGVDTINGSDVMTPSELSGNEQFSSCYNTEKDQYVPVLTGEEFSDLFGLFDEYGLFKTVDGGPPAFDGFSDLA